MNSSNRHRSVGRKDVDPAVGRIESTDSVRPNAPGTQGLQPLRVHRRQLHDVDGPERTQLSRGVPGAGGQNWWRASGSRVWPPASRTKHAHDDLPAGRRACRFRDSRRAHQQHLDRSGSGREADRPNVAKARGSRRERKRACIPILTTSHPSDHTGIGTPRSWMVASGVSSRMEEWS